jgi:hypothetical protein
MQLISKSMVFACVSVPLIFGLPAYADDAEVVTDTAEPAVAAAEDPPAESETGGSDAAAEEAAADKDAAESTAAKKYDWAFTGYVAWISGDQLGDMLIGNAELSDNKIWVAALTYRILTFYKDVDWEVEGQVAKNGGPEQWNWELNALTSLRWNRVIWDKYVDTSFAAGLGLSWASEIPPVEVENHGSSEQLLAYILAEMTLSPPKYPQWAGVLRIHHRSSAYGAFADDIQGASNSLGIGLKYRF